jgi:hypothetical protein
MRLLTGGLLCVVLALGQAACGSATRALVHEEDIQKVFPWDRNKQEVTIRAKPRTLLANTCFLFGSYEEVKVTPETTFYIVDELDQHSAYTPSRSPIRRLAPVESMEIDWPLREARKAPGHLDDSGDAEKEKKEKGEPGPGKEAGPAGKQKS